MIGDKIRNVLDAWGDMVASGEAIPYAMFEAGCVELRDAARMADALERRPVPAQLRAVASGDMRDDVVSLDAWRRRIPAGPGGRPAPTGGPAA